MAVVARPSQVAAPRRLDRFKAWTTAVSLAAPLLLIALVLVVGQTAIPAIQRFGPGFITSQAWNPVKESFGALPFIFGTLVTALLGLALALPVGVGVAIFLAEQSAARVRATIGIGVELLAAIPSVIYGIWGLYVFAPWFLAHFSRPISERFAGVGFLAGPARQTNMLVAAIVLAVMILPTLSSISRDVIKAVPGGMREASVALGATWWETIWKVVLPAARAGIFGATILALGRALGETIAVTMVIGNSSHIPPSIFAPAYTLASVIANEFNESSGLHQAALIELGLILMIVTLGVNVLAVLLVHSRTREAIA
jgi:phosphate transport system permease protein